MQSNDSRTGTNILTDIVQWSRDLPGWQRDALRRIVENGELSSEDIADLGEICRTEHGVADPKPEPAVAEALLESHVPAGVSSSESVAITSICNVENVNALDPSQRISFAPTGLTVVFGYNGSGKSGYGRILRRACRARSKGESILHNVLNPPRTLTPASAEVTYQLDGVDQSPEQWIDGQRPVDVFGSVSFFDSDCAAVHVRKKNDIAFTPYGLDVLPKLGDACKSVQKTLQDQKAQLESRRPRFLNAPQASGETAVGKLLSRLNHNTNIDSLEQLASLTADDLSRTKQLEQQLANDPTKLAKELTSRLAKIQRLQERLNKARSLLSQESITKLVDLAASTTAKRQAAEAAARADFLGDGTLEIGSAAWRSLWEAARNFSQTVLPDASYPPVDTDDAVCLLCQQPYDESAKARMLRFEQFVQDDTAKQAEAAAEALKNAVSAILEVPLSGELIDEEIKEVAVADDAAAVQLRATIDALQSIRKAVKSAADSDDWTAVGKEVSDSPDGLAALIQALMQQVADVQASADPEARKAVEQELAEFKAREWLSTVLGDVKNHISHLCTIHRLKAAIKETNPRSITTKSKELAQLHVTDQLRDAFATEIKKLEQGVRRLNVELMPTSGTVGSSYFQVQLVGATKADIGSVVSEGEHRCIALAGFLSELATEKSGSAIVFDDPVTSLDHHWRECFAKRLVDEASTRQVIVFTHDIVFLHDLQTMAIRTTTPIKLQHVRAHRDHAGYVDDELPWVAQKTNDRIERLQQHARATRTDYENHNDEVYQRDICLLYGKIRATVERAVEERFFHGVVLRHRDYVNVSNVNKMTAVTADHCNRIQNLFQRCCDVTEAHDRAALRSFGVPTPDDAINDLQELRAIIDEVKDEQKNV